MYYGSSRSRLSGSRQKRDEDVCSLGGRECHRMFQTSLPMGLYRAQEASGDFYTQPLVGRVWKVLEMPKEVHTTLHYGGRHERSPKLYREFQRSLVYSCTQVCTQNDVGYSRIFLNCKEPSKVSKSSIGAYKQVRASFGQDTKQVRS